MNRTLILALLMFPVVSNAQLAPNSTSQAIALINSFDSIQQTKALFAFEDMSRYDWHYLPPTLIPRKGVSVKEMDSLQKEYVYALLHCFLSDSGYARAVNIMANEIYLKELEPDLIHRVPENYYIAFYGNPEQDSIWGWKFSGHHLALNFTIVDEHLACTPVFFGVYPAEITTGSNAGRRIIADEEDMGFELINMLTAEQQAKAIFQQRAFNDIVTTNAIAVGPLTPVGIPAQELTEAQKLLLNKLIATHLNSMPPEVAEARMQRMFTEDFDQIRFAWAGGLMKGIPHYYRIQGATFLIEFDNTSHNANHIHIVWRDFNGDFGVDLLQEHYLHDEDHDHDHD